MDISDTTWLTVSFVDGNGLATEKCLLKTAHDDSVYT